MSRSRQNQRRQHLARMDAQAATTPPAQRTTMLVQSFSERVLKTYQPKFLERVEHKCWCTGGPCVWRGQDHMQCEPPAPPPAKKRWLERLADWIDSILDRYPQ